MTYQYAEGDPVIIMGEIGVLYRAHIHRVAEDTVSVKLDGLSPIIYTFANEDVNPNGVVVGDGVGIAAHGTIYPAFHPQASRDMARQEISILQRKMIVAANSATYAPTEQLIGEFEKIHKELVDALILFRKVHVENGHG